MSIQILHSAGSFVLQSNEIYKNKRVKRFHNEKIKQHIN